MPISTQRQGDFVSMFRNMMMDVDGTKNILDGKTQHYSDDQCLFFLNQALRDINITSPMTTFTVESFPVGQEDVMITGAMIFAAMADGILQLRNQLDYNDAGLSVNLFNKTAAYQGWAGFLTQMYDKHKMDFKRQIMPNYGNCGFYGIRSLFDPLYGNNSRY